MFFRSCFMVAKRQSKLTTFLGYVFRFKKAVDPRSAYDWQLVVAEAMLVGLDTVLIMGTGAGKMILFMLPLLMDQQKKVLVVLPLKVLQDDQVHLHGFSSFCSSYFSIFFKPGTLIKWRSMPLLSIVIHGRDLGSRRSVLFHSLSLHN